MADREAIKGVVFVEISWMSFKIPIAEIESSISGVLETEASMSVVADMIPTAELELLLDDRFCKSLATQVRIC